MSVPNYGGVQPPTSNWSGKAQSAETRPPQAVSPSAAPAAPLLRAEAHTWKQKPISFEKMAELQQEIRDIDKRIGVLQQRVFESQALREFAQHSSSFSLQQQQQLPLVSNTSLEADDACNVHDPSVEHMLVVELCQLAAKGDVEGVRILLCSGANPNCRDYNGHTPLHLACSNGHTAVAMLLVEFGGDPSIPNNEGVTPLHLAERNDHMIIVQNLIKMAKQNDLGLEDASMYDDSVASIRSECSSRASQASTSSSHQLDYSSIPQPMVGSLCVIMVGLPGRGKSYIATQIRRYFQWNGLPCRLLSYSAYVGKLEKQLQHQPGQPAVLLSPSRQCARMGGETSPSSSSLPMDSLSFPDESGRRDHGSNPYGTHAKVTTPSHGANTASSSASIETQWKDVPLNTPELDFRVATLIAKDVEKFTSATGGVVIIDGANSTAVRRISLLHSIKEATEFKDSRIIFVEIINNDKDIVRLNIERSKGSAGLASPTYIEEYYNRIAQHEAVYKTLNPVSDKNLSYIRIEDRKTYSLNNISGWMPSRLSYMLHNLSHTPVDFYLTRAGQYVDMTSGRIGGNSRLTDRGRVYSEVLFEFFKRELGMTPFLVMTSCAKRCTQTAHYFAKEAVKQLAPTGAPTAVSTPTDVDDKGPRTAGHSPADQEPPQLNCRIAYFPTLDDLNHGDCEGQYLSDIKATLPSTIQSMQADPYNIAWPNGESIHQVFNARLEPHIHDIQASDVPLLIVSHLHLLQGLHSFFATSERKSVAPQSAYEIDIPFECVIKIHFNGVDRVAQVINLSSEVDTIMFERTGVVKKESWNEDFNVFRKFTKPTDTHPHMLKIDVHPLPNYILKLDPNLSAAVQAAAAAGNNASSRRDGRGGASGASGISPAVSKALIAAVAERAHKTSRDQLKELRQHSMGECVRSVEAVLLVHAYNHPHVLLLRHTPKQANARILPSTSMSSNVTYRLPGGWCKRGEHESVAVLQKLGFDLLGEDKDGKDAMGSNIEKDTSSTTVDLSGGADSSGVGSARRSADMYFRVADVLGRWYRPHYDLYMYPYIPPHIPERELKEVRTVFLVQMEPSMVFTVLHPDYDLVAVPLFELYDNVAKYGPLLASLPQQLSRLNINYCS